MSKVVIFGMGEFAQVAAVYLEADSDYRVAAFTTDREHLHQTSLLGKEVVPFEDLPRTHPPSEYELFVAVGYRGVNQARAEAFQRCKGLGYRCIRYVCSKAIQWGHLHVGENCFIFENNVLQPFVHIGDNCVLWSGNHIGHHTRIGNHCFVTSQVVVSGGVEVGDYCFLGVNATIADHVKIAPRCVIGAGALVLADTEEDGAYLNHAAEKARVPAHRLRAFHVSRRSA